MSNINNSLELVKQFENLVNLYPNVSPNKFCKVRKNVQSYIPNFFAPNADKEIEIASFVLADTPIFIDDSVWWTNPASVLYNKRITLTGKSNSRKDVFRFSQHAFPLEEINRFASLVEPVPSVRLDILGEAKGDLKSTFISKITNKETRENSHPIKDSKGNIYWIKSAKHAEVLANYMQSIVDAMLLEMSNGYDVTVKIHDIEGKRDRLAFRTLNNK